MTRRPTRRQILAATGSMALTTSIAGCTGSGGGGSGDGGGGTATESGDGDGGGGGSGGSTATESGDGESSSEGTPIPPEEFPEFDASDPQWPQRTSTLLDAGFETGVLADLERMEEDPREEPRYGDPVPETPSSESELIDPDTLTFALAPTEDPTVYRDTLQPLLDNIAEETGKEVQFQPLQSYAAQVEAMRSERLHISGFSTGTVPFAVNIANAVPFSIQINPEGKFGYRLWTITQIDSPINNLQDLSGKTVAHSDPSSNSGNLAPRALVPAATDPSINAEEDYSVAFSGGHQQTALGVANGDYPAGHVCSTCYSRVVQDGQLDPEQIKAVWASDPFPTTAFSYRYNLTPELQEGIRAAFLDYDYMDTSIAEEFNNRGVWREIEYATVWDIILKIQQSLDVEYNVGNIEE
jgi:phosphonate transport system substrate-binding protein